MRFRIGTAGAAALCLAVAGCASYPERLDEIKGKLSSPSPDAAPPVYDVYGADGRNRLLALEERGRLAQLRGDYRASAKEYGEAIAFSDALEDKAVVSVGDVTDSTLAVAYGNDLALDYPVVGFERMMLHVLDAFDRLALGDVDGFGVDVRNLERCRGMAQTKLKREREALERERYMKGKGDGGGIQADSSYKDFMDKIAALAPGLKHSTDNVYALFLMALYREWKGDRREALAHYAELRRIWPGNKAVDAGVARCNGERAPAGCGEVVVFLEEGFIPPKRTNHASFGNGQIFSTLYMTLPNYAVADCLPYEDGGPLVVFEGGKYVAAASTLCDLAPLAVKAHEERLKGIIARKALTSGMASGMVHVSNAFNGTIHSNPFVEAVNLFCGFFTAIAADAMMVASERPDLRSWLLLPRQVQAARFPLKAGRHRLTFASAGKTLDLDVDVRDGGLTVVHCISASGGIKGFSAVLAK